MPKRKKQNITDDTNFIGAVRGVRFFHYNSRLRVLQGSRNVLWYSPRQKARCKGTNFGFTRHTAIPGETVPHISGRCGINMFGPGALKHIDSEMLIHLPGYINYGSVAVGLTEGWGKVIEHEDGYRVEQARVVMLLAHPESHVVQYGLDDGWANVPIIRVRYPDEAALHIKKFFKDGQLTSIPSSEML